MPDEEANRCAKRHTSCTPEGLCPESAMSNEWVSSKGMRPRVERAVFRRRGVHFECELLKCVLIDALVNETLFNGAER